MLIHYAKKYIPNWVKRFIKKTIWQVRRMTWRFRCLPDFMVIGAMKAGTSSLHTYLTQHPQLLPSYQKEIHFFDKKPHLDIDDLNKNMACYRAFFPLKRQRKVPTKIFESTPRNLFNPLAAKRIFNLMPKVKLIILLRNPTQRTLSHYFHTTYLGRENLTLMDALRAEETRLNASQVIIPQAYKQRSIYHQQIARFYRYFPKHQILILSSEEFFNNTEQMMATIFKFIGVDSGYKIQDLTPHNVGINKKQVSQDVITYLDDYFAPHNEALYQLLDKDFGW